MYVTPVDAGYRKQLQSHNVPVRVHLPPATRVRDAHKYVQKTARRWVQRVPTEKSAMRLSVCAARDHMILKQFRFHPQLRGGGVVDAVGAAAKAVTRVAADHPVAAAAGAAVAAAATAYAVLRRKNVVLDEQQVRAVFVNNADAVRDELGVQFEFKSVVLKDDDDGGDHPECRITFEHNGQQFVSDQPVGPTTQDFVRGAAEFLKSEMRSIALLQLCGKHHVADEEQSDQSQDHPRAAYPYVRDKVTDSDRTVVACSPDINAVVEGSSNVVKFLRNDDHTHVPAAPSPALASVPESDEDEEDV